MGTIRGSFSSRFDDTPLAFGLKRYEESGGGDKSIWQFAVTRFCNGDELISTFPTPATLRKMARFFEDAAVAVETDGNRKPVHTANQEQPQ